MKACRQDFTAVAALLIAGSPSDIVLTDKTNDNMRAAFAAYASTHEPASIRRCWSSWNVLCDLLYTGDLIPANPIPFVERPKPAKTLTRSLPRPAVGAPRDPQRGKVFSVGRDRQAITRGTTRSRVRWAFHRAAPEAQPVRGALVHRLRHTYATELGNSDISVCTLMKLLGHGSMATSQRRVAGRTRNPRGRRAKPALRARSRCARGFGPARDGPVSPMGMDHLGRRRRPDRVRCPQ